jgi:hypothetical protein
MGLLKTIIVGAALVAGVKYATKKRPEDGKSLFDDLQDALPGLKDKAMQFKDKVKQDYTTTAADEFNGM